MRKESTRRQWNDRNRKKRQITIWIIWFLLLKENIQTLDSKIIQFYRTIIVQSSIQSIVSKKQLLVFVMVRKKLALFMISTLMYSYGVFWHNFYIQNLISVWELSTVSSSTKQQSCNESVHNSTTSCTDASNTERVF